MYEPKPPTASLHRGIFVSMVVSGTCLYKPIRIKGCCHSVSIELLIKPARAPSRLKIPWRFCTRQIRIGTSEVITATLVGNITSAVLRLFDITQHSSDFADILLGIQNWLTSKFTFNMHWRSLEIVMKYYRTHMKTLEPCSNSEQCSRYRTPTWALSFVLDSVSQVMMKNSRKRNSNISTLVIPIIHLCDACCFPQVISSSSNGHIMIWWLLPILVNVKSIWFAYANWIWNRGDWIWAKCFLNTTRRSININ